MGIIALANSNTGAKPVAHGACWCHARKQKKDKTVILKAYQERVSMRGLARIFHVARQQVALWIREHTQALPPLQSTLLPCQSDDVLEGDEAWSFV